MPIQEETIEQVNLATSKYKYGFSTDLEVDKAPKGLNENIVVDNAKDPIFVIGSINKYFNIDPVFKSYKNLSGLN